MRPIYYRHPQDYKCSVSQRKGGNWCEVSQSITPADLAERVYRRLARRLVGSGTGPDSLFGAIREETMPVASLRFENVHGFSSDRALWAVSSWLGP